MSPSLVTIISTVSSRQRSRISLLISEEEERKREGVRKRGGSKREREREREKFIDNQPSTSCGYPQLVRHSVQNGTHSIKTRVVQNALQGFTRIHLAAGLDHVSVTI